ncbi:MAG: NAD(P)H-dependent flavin oxidoreductase YrpB (nitropropane dioxygenase family), partial [Cryomorphaceae bacterium]
MINRRDAIRWTLGTTAAVAIVPASSHASKIGDKNTLETRFSRQFKLKHPFVCAGMAFVCDTSPLAISVALAGGVGCLAGSLLSPSTLAKRIEEIQAATHGLFHVNFLKPFPHQEQLEVCIAKRVPIVSFHWGFPDASTVSRLQASGISVWAQVGSVDAAKEVNDKGANCIVVQGTEAGGHNYGVLPLASSMSLVRAALGDEVLLLGAGGISDGRTAAAAFAAGADGIR